MNIRRTLGTLFIVGMIAPAGLLFSQTASQPTSAKATAKRRMDPATPSSKFVFNRIEDLALSVRKDVATLKFGTNGTSVTWKIHSIRLARVKSQVNQMEKDIRRLSSRKQTLPNWQEQLLGSVKEDTHELVYQSTAAIKVLNAKHNTTVLATTRYPQYIDRISEKANDVGSLIGTVFQQHGFDMD